MSNKPRTPKALPVGSLPLAGDRAEVHLAALRTSANKAYHEAIGTRAKNEARSAAAATAYAARKAASARPAKAAERAYVVEVSGSYLMAGGAWATDPQRALPFETEDEAAAYATWRLVGPWRVVPVTVQVGR